MGILKGIFKGKIKTDDVVTSAISGIDKLFYTKEEKVDDEIKKDAFRFKVADALAEYTKSTLSENTNRSRSRRFISQAFTTVFLSLVVLYVIISFTTLPTFAIKEMLTNSTMDTAMILILTFHYTGYYLPKAVKAAKSMIDERKDRKNTKEENEKE